MVMMIMLMIMMSVDDDDDDDVGNRSSPISINAITSVSNLISTNLSIGIRSIRP